MQSSVTMHVSELGVLTGTVAIDSEIYHFEVYFVCDSVCVRMYVHKILQ